MKKLLLSMFLVLFTTLVHAQKLEDFQLIRNGNYNDIIACLHNTTDKRLLSDLYVDFEYADGTVEKNVEVLEYPIQLSIGREVVEPGGYQTVKFLVRDEPHELPKTYKIRKIYFLKK